MGLARISHQLTAEARDKAAITSLRLLTVLTVLYSTPPRAERRAPRTGGLLTHFASPRGEKRGLAYELLVNWHYVRFLFNTDAGHIQDARFSVLAGYAIGESSEWYEHSGIGFVVS